MKQEISETGTTNYFSPDDVKKLRGSFQFTVDSWPLQPDGSLILNYDITDNGKRRQRYLNGMAYIAGLVVEGVESQGEHPIG